MFDAGFSKSDTITMNTRADLNLTLQNALHALEGRETRKKNEEQSEKRDAERTAGEMEEIHRRAKRYKRIAQKRHTKKSCENVRC